MNTDNTKHFFICVHLCYLWPIRVLPGGKECLRASNDRSLAVAAQYRHAVAQYRHAVARCRHAVAQYRRAVAQYRHTVSPGRPNTPRPKW